MGTDIELESSSEPLRILVVDDDRDCANSFAMLLAVNGHDARVCFDGREALETAGAFRPHVIFLDLMMPGMSGFDVCSRLRRSGSTERPMIVALTGSGRPKDRLGAAGAGFDGYLLKPTETEEWASLLDRARALVSKRRARLPDATDPGLKGSETPDSSSLDKAS